MKLVGNTLKETLNWIWFLPLLVVTVYLLQDPLLLSPTDYTLLSSLLILSFLLYYLVIRVRTVELFWPGICVMIAFSSSLLSGYPWNGIEYGLLLVAVSSLFYLLQSFSSVTLKRGLCLFLGLYLLILLFPIMTQYIYQYDLLGLYGLMSFPSGEFLNPNVLGRVLGMALFFTVCLDLPEVPKELTYGLGFFLAILICLTGSRGALLGLFVGLFTFINRHYEFQWTWIIGLALILFMAFIVLVGPIEHVTNLQRIDLVKESGLVIKKRPFLGVGGWNFGLVYPSVSLDDHWQRHPHSLPLWIATEFGLIGFIVAGCWIYSRWYTLFRSRLSPLIIFVLIHECVDTMLWIPGVLFLTVGLYSVVSMSAKEKRSVDVQHRAMDEGNRFNQSGIATVLLCSFMLSLVTFFTTKKFQRGVLAANDHNWSQAVENWSKNGTGFSEVHQALAYQNKGQTAKAYDLLKSARDRNRYDPYYLKLLARLSEEMGQRRRAERLFRKMNALDPHEMITNQDNRDRSENYPASFQKIGKANFQPTKVRKHPRRAVWYLPLVDRAIRNDNCQLALNRSELLLNYPEVTHFARLQLETRRRSCYRMSGSDNRAEQIDRQVTQLRNYSPSLREQFHRLFYRRQGLDHAFFNG